MKFRHARSFGATTIVLNAGHFTCCKHLSQFQCIVSKPTHIHSPALSALSFVLRLNNIIGHSNNVVNRLKPRGDKHPIWYMLNFFYKSTFVNMNTKLVFYILYRFDLHIYSVIQIMQSIFIM